MKTIKANSQLKYLKYIVASLAIAIGVTSLQPVDAQTSRKRLPEIGWSSRLSSMGIDKVKNVGKTYNFYCQAAESDLIHAPIWGTNVYTSNSGICTTAVHSGLLSEEGGFITIELLEGQEFYTGSTKNKITSKDHISTNMSYTFIGESVVNLDHQTDQANQQQRRPSTIQRVMVNTVQRGVERSIERVITDIFD